MSKKKRKTPSSKILDDMDSRFAFIAGYTPGGFPYGTTWEELGIEPAKPLEEKLRWYEKKANTPTDPPRTIDDSELPF